jgi:hypothetical protein
LPHRGVAFTIGVPPLLQAVGDEVARLPRCAKDDRQ